MIYHITLPEAIHVFEHLDYISAASLDAEGFIHCSTAAQVEGVLERYFEGINAIVILSIDEKLLQHELKYEAATANDFFPHIYGVINKGAIVATDIYHRVGNERFDLVFA